MNRIRVLLVCAQSLLGESLEFILGNLEDVELIVPPAIDHQTLCSFIENRPDVVVVAEEDNCEEPSSLTARILKAYPAIPVARVGLEQNFVHLFTSCILPARSTALIEAIRKLSDGESRQND